MTLVVGVAAPDGIVLAADSRTTHFPDGVSAGSRHRVMTDTAEKVFTVSKRFAVATFNDAFIGESTIAGVMSEFEAEVEKDPPDGIGQLAERLGAFFHDRYSKWRESVGRPVQDGESARIGFLVAGYDADGIGHVYEVHVPYGERTPEELHTDVGGIAPRGQVDVVDRLLAGVDWGAFGATGVPIPTPVLNALNGLEYNIIYPITLQDAVDFATFLIRATIDMQRFSDGTRSAPAGVPGCGGEISAVAVKRREVEWVSRADLRLLQRGGEAEGSL